MQLPRSDVDSWQCYVMQLIDDDGRVLDAEYLTETDGTRLAVVIESRSDMSGSRPPRNPDYNPALMLLLTRLGQLDAVLVDALVDSQRTRNWHCQNRTDDLSKRRSA
jgi:hypothetical protein